MLPPLFTAMRKINYRIGLLFAYFLFYLLTGAFIGSRPPLPFFPYGFASLIVLGIATAAAFMAHKNQEKRIVFLKIFSICWVLYAGYVLTQAFLHINLGGNIYWIRSLAGLPLLYFVWLFMMDRDKCFQFFGYKKSPSSNLK